MWLTKKELINAINITIEDYEKHSTDENKDADFIYNMSIVLKQLVDYLNEA